MSQVYSSQLFLGHAVGTVVVTVPGSEVWVIRTITAFYPAVIGSQQMQIIDDGSSATVVQDDNGSGIGATWHALNDLRIVWPPGRSFTVLGGGNVDIGLFGYAFTL